MKPLNLLVTGGILLASPAIHAATLVVTSAAPGANNDAVGNGTWSNPTGTGTWVVTSTTGSLPGQGFTNTSITGGANGVQYVTNHTWGNTAGIGGANPATSPPAINNTITFSWTGNAANCIRLTQAPYEDNTGWNGGSGDTGNQFMMTWAGGGAATFSDPGNDLDDSTTTAVDEFPAIGGTFTSGTVVRQPTRPSQSANNTDDWFIDLPVGVTSLTLDWSNYDDDTTVHHLVNEWMAFDLIPHDIPEPSRAMLLLLGGSLMALRRRRNS